MKARFLALCALVPVVALLGACATGPAASPGNALARVAQTQTLKLGYREDAQPFSF